MDDQHQPGYLKSEEVDDFTRRWVLAQPQVEAFLRMVIYDQNDVQDVLQRVAIKALEKHSQFDESRPYSAWAIGIAKYEVLAYRRTAAREKLVFSAELLNKLTDRSEALSSRWEAFREALRECVARLSGKSLRAIRLRYSESLSTSDIAAALDIRVENARKILSRTRHSLRECIEEKV